jgi:integrase
MTRRRGNNEGSIYRRADGRWEASVSVGGGKRRRYYAKTRQEAARKLNEALKAHGDGLPVTSERQTVEKFLEGWLETVKASVRIRTHLRYEQYCRLHLAPYIGKLPLGRLSAQHLQRLYADRRAAGLSATSVAHLHAVIHKALGQAAKWDIIPRNVADLVEKPRMETPEMKTLSPEQARSFLDAARDDRLEGLWVLALNTGARQGELLGLKWDAIDLDRGTVQIRASLQRVSGRYIFAEPKTARSRRQILVTESVIAALRRHRSAQLEERLRAGSAWCDYDLVFSDRYGQPILATELTRGAFYPLLARAGLPKVRFHDLRHTAASLLLGRGVHPKIVADMLGHSTIAITIDLYSHTTPAMHRQAALALEAVLAR